MRTPASGGLLSVPVPASWAGVPLVPPAELEHAESPMAEETQNVPSVVEKMIAKREVKSIPHRSGRARRPPVHIVTKSKLPRAPPRAPGVLRVHFASRSAVAWTQLGSRRGRYRGHGREAATRRWHAGAHQVEMVAEAEDLRTLLDGKGVVDDDAQRRRLRR